MNNINIPNPRIVDVSASNREARFCPEDFIKEAERRYHGSIGQLALQARRRGSRILLVAGPSGSGKTTTARKLCEAFQALGKNAQMVSLDDFYLPRHLLPRLPDGEPDFETVDGLDIEKIHSCLGELLSQGASEFPVFSFHEQEEPAKTRHIQLGKNDYLVIEGIHALNPIISQGLGREGIMKVYLNALTSFRIGDTEVFSPRSIRMVRRMVRDFHFRGASISFTLSLWDKVCQGEERYINPYVGEADAVLDTTHEYEPHIFHNFLFPILMEADPDPQWIGLLQNLVETFDQFYDLPQGYVPRDSMLREFIGWDQVF